MDSAVFIGAHIDTEVVGSNPTFSVCERGSSDGRARKRKPNHVS